MAPRRPRRSSGRWRARAGGDAGPSEPPLPPDVAAHAAQLEAERLPLLRRQLHALGLIASRRSRAALARRLARALHAQRALARLPAASHDRFDRARAGHVARAGGYCRLCGGAVSPPRRTFCCDECVHFHRLRTSGAHVRKALAIRDEGIRSLCGINALAAYRKAVLEVRTALAKPAPARVIGTVVTGGPSSETGSASAALDKAHTSRATAALALEVAVRGGHFEKHATLSSEKAASDSSSSLLAASSLSSASSGSVSLPLVDLV
ncbi:hypothetical protein AB1Y20_009495 [Prymnesium parvum]|uniref:Uncharacterized protein n=1 Tax=Prymnesium parvum TaxID=97485 RepID=A0AB34K4X6_PRYPA